MSEYRRYADIISKTKPEELDDLMCEVFKMMEVRCPHLYKHTLIKMHEMAFGGHFDDVLAEQAVCEMRNTDGTHGEHWTRKETDAYADQMGIVHKADFYVAMNMMYSDYSQVLGSDANLCARMAKSYLEDPDGSEDKLLMTYLWS